VYVCELDKFGIPEPKFGEEIPEVMLDFVFVPLLAINNSGHRVGYGKGFYDRFLNECHPETLKIGLSFFEPEEKIEDIFDSDIQMNYCVTPNKIYSFD
jgi:5-formyltetrahydrofolate cyclo-ligase